MRSLSAGVAGVLISGVVLTSATVATANSADTETVAAPQSEATLAAFDFSPETLVSTWGAPEVVVPSVDLKAEAAKKAAAEKAEADKHAAEEKAETDRVAAEKAAAEQAAQAEADRVAAEKSAAEEATKTQELSTEGATVESTQAPVATEAASAPVAAPAASNAAVSAPVAAPATSNAAASTPAPAAKKQPTLAAGTNSSKRNAVVNAAQAAAKANAQTDCTALVSNSLAAIGVNFHGWPADYQSLGTIVSASEAQPGDIIYYASNGFGSSHVALYIGNGQAVHGGWNGMGTTVFSANLPSASAPIFISPRAYNN